MSTDIVSPRIDARRLGGLHPRLPVRQQEIRCRPEPAVPLDGVRVEQLVVLLHDLLLVSRDSETLPERLAQTTAFTLFVAGAAVAVLQDGIYTILATYGLGPEYRAQYDAQPMGDSALSIALRRGSPLVLDADDSSLRTVVFPFG